MPTQIPLSLTELAAQLGPGLSVVGGKLVIAPGGIIQTKYKEYGTSTSVSANTPVDDSIPQSSEATEIISDSIIMSSATAKLRVEGVVYGTCSSATTVTASLFKGADTAAMHATGGGNGDATTAQSIPISYEFVPGAAGSITIGLRVGASTGTYKVNSASGGSRLYGGVAKCSLKLTEIAA